MAHVLIVHVSDMGHTAKLAERFAAGVEEAGGRPDLRALPAEGDIGVTLDDVIGCDALVLGSPVHHRSVHFRLKQFIEDVVYPPYIDDLMVGKVGAVFSCGGGHGDMGGGVEIMQLGLLAALAGNGMLLVPLPKSTPGFDEAGSHWGPHARAGGPKMEPIELSQGMLDAAFHHGANVTRVAAAVGGRQLFAFGNVSPAADIRPALIKDAEQRAASVGALAGRRL